MGQQFAQVNYQDAYANIARSVASITTDILNMKRTLNQMNREKEFEKAQLEMKDFNNKAYGEANTFLSSIEQLQPYAKNIRKPFIGEDAKEYTQYLG
jgi:hypothetical protein